MCKLFDAIVLLDVISVLDKVIFQELMAPVASIVPGNDCESNTVYVDESLLSYVELSVEALNSHIRIFCLGASESS